MASLQYITADCYETAGQPKQSRSYSDSLVMIGTKILSMNQLLMGRATSTKRKQEATRHSRR